MPAPSLKANVRRQSKVAIIDLPGEINAKTKERLNRAYAEAIVQQPTAVLLNFGQVNFITSSGIGLVVTLLIRANRQGQRLVTVRLNQHYRHIFDLTKLNEAIAVYDTEADALAAIDLSA